MPRFLTVLAPRSRGPQYEYLWADGVRVKTPIKLSAPAYVNALFDWVEEQVSAWVWVGEVEGVV